MSDQTNSEDESSKEMNEWSKLRNHNLEEFARKSLLSNDYVASYLIGFLGEGDLRLLKENEYQQNIINGMVSLKWQLFYDINFEISYSKLQDTNPTTQEEFDALLKALLEGR